MLVGVKLGYLGDEQGLNLLGSEGSDPLMSTSTPQSHHFALVTALGMLTENKEP